MAGLPGLTVTGPGGVGPLNRVAMGPSESMVRLAGGVTVLTVALAETCMVTTTCPDPPTNSGVTCRVVVVCAPGLGASVQLTVSSGRRLVLLSSRL